ncbi:MAG: sugar isomerase [Planctomycetota bacterium]
MTEHDPSSEVGCRAHCCGGGHPTSQTEGLSRRGFLGGMGGAAIGGAALAGLSWAAVAAAEQDAEVAPARKPLMVKPVLVYSTPQRRPQSSWRSWGGIETQEQAEAEQRRIAGELEQLRQQADFPVEFLPVALVRTPQEADAVDLATADTILLYAAGGPQTALEALASKGKDVVFFVRWKSGPVYLWYEIVSPRLLRKHTDSLQLQSLDDSDIVVDSQDEILWRLRALCGLKNTRGCKILAVGGPGAWAQPSEKRAALTETLAKNWGFEIETINYDDLGKLIGAARADAAAVARAKAKADAYLQIPNTTLETERHFLDDAMLLDGVFRGLMQTSGCSALTINSCMGTIMKYAETSACMTLSTLNDAGFLAFCESDFVVIPAGVLLASIAGRPMFLNDPTYPHAGIITLAHCTAPRKLDGKTLEPARILTHFESDYGAAPKVEMRIGQKVTNIIPDFAISRYVGLAGEIVEAPFRPICRSQIDIRFTCDSRELAQRMPGFHWMTIYGDYLREAGYALRRLKVEWETLA